MKKENNTCYFFIGTEAELIKVFPIIIECQNRDKLCHIIASGQNDLKKSRILQFVNLNGKFIELSDEADIKKSAAGLLNWFIKTKKKSLNIIKKNFDNNELSGQPFIVHGDTVSTFMGAMIGKNLKMKVCHVEAGLRSHHLLNPFPEEIDRILTSRLARMHFAPGAEATHNLIKVKGEVINTQYNTILDSLALSRKMPIMTNGLDEIIVQDYFVFVMHRQENLMNKEFVKQVIQQIKEAAQERKCVLILHKITENALLDMGILEELKQNENFILLPRVDYFDFMKLLEHACFVITDGGSNQEELHYMGKPCLIMRKTTERQEGIGSNAIMYEGDVSVISEFIKNYKKYEIKSLVGNQSPSDIICDYL